MKKVLCILLVILLAIPLVACQTEREHSGKEQSGVVSNDVSGDGKELRSFPLETTVWNETITVLCVDNQPYSISQISAEEQTTEPVNDAFYNRNAFIKENFGLTITPLIVQNNDEIVSTLRNNYTSGIEEFQAVAASLSYLKTTALEGILYDINDVSNIDTTNEWWDQSAVRDLTLMDKLWYLTGDIFVEDDEATWAMYFNKDLINEHNLENPYDLVRKNEWNIDKMAEMIKSVHLMNGDKMSFDPEVGDVFGMVAQTYDLYCFMIGSNQPMIYNDGKNVQLRIGAEDNISTFNRLFEILADTNNVGIAEVDGTKGIEHEQKYKIFTNGNALFMTGAISVVSNEFMRDANIHYGILPLPKKNQSQESYTTTMTPFWSTFIAIPTTNVQKLDATTYCLEAMAYYSKKMVTHEYYDRTLNLKRLQDEDSSEMLEIIFANRNYDLGCVYNFNSCLYQYSWILSSRENTLVSKFDSIKSGIEMEIEKLLEQVED